METILCKNCNHFRANPNIAMCYNPAAVDDSLVDYVYGIKVYQPCRDMRSQEYKCGVEAKWFSRIGTN